MPWTQGVSAVSDQSVSVVKNFEGSIARYGPLRAIARSAAFSWLETRALKQHRICGALNSGGPSHESNGIHGMSKSVMLVIRQVFTWQWSFSRCQDRIVQESISIHLLQLLIYNGHQPPQSGHSHRNIVLIYRWQSDSATTIPFTIKPNLGGGFISTIVNTYQSLSKIINNTIPKRYSLLNSFAASVCCQGVPSVIIDRPTINHYEWTINHHWPW